jgi:hypothetical protein
VHNEHSTLLFKAGAEHNMKEKHTELQSKWLINSKQTAENLNKNATKYASFL